MLAGCGRESADPRAAPNSAPPPVAAATAPEAVAGKLVAAARREVEKGTLYEPGYHRIAYPGGDVPSGGVCTDLVIRAFRGAGLDLQQLVHEDMRANFAKYPKLWNLAAPDPHIDHRRVPNLMVYF